MVLSSLVWQGLIDFASDALLHAGCIAVVVTVQGQHMLSTHQQT